jgi:cation transporter-like permease
MLWTLVVVLLVLWLIGTLTGYVLGGFLHTLLVIAAIIILIRLLRGERSV